VVPWHYNLRDVGPHASDNRRSESETCAPLSNGDESARSDTLGRMSIEELESEAMKLEPKARARLAGKLLESLESLSEEENDRVWADEASRRDSDLNTDENGGRDADVVLRDARNRLR